MNPYVYLVSSAADTIGVYAMLSTASLVAQAVSFRTQESEFYVEHLVINETELVTRLQTWMNGSRLGEPEE